MLENIGGGTVEKAVRNIMLKVASYKVYQDYNMTGRHGKRDLNTTGLVKLIISKSFWIHSFVYFLFYINNMYY